MKHPTAMEQGHFYKAELPSYPEGQTGKGVAIGGKVTAKKGSPLTQGDGSVAKLRKEWSEAKNAHGKFPPF